jgi:ATP-binding cassette subfamily B protein
MRLYELGPHFRGAYNDVRSELRRDQLKFAREQNLAELLSGVFALAVVAGALLIMAGGARERSISLGQLAMFFHAFQQGLGLGRTLLSSAQRIFTGSLFLEYLIELLELEPDIASPAEPRGWPASPAVSFRNVSFRYPGARREALRSLDLDIPAGSIVALLGPNGAGKSTFAKLLTRLYDPDDGRIEIGGVDIRDLSLDELRRRVGILPQSPVRFNETARENVALGKVHARLEPDAIEQAVRAAGAEEFLANLPKGLDNILGRWFQDGAELSGGEWQRVATARALVRDAQILVLDEPTSNMDPWSEAEWTVRLREHLRGRTVVLITHRLTTARHADWIVVMERGSVIEQGSHGDLQAQSSGSYSKAWLS